MSCNLLVLVKRVHTVNGEKTNVEDAYADVFQGIGKLKVRAAKYCRPVIHAPRKVPLSLRDQLNAELLRLEALDILDKVEEPTEWIHSLVIVDMKDGLLRLCMGSKRAQQVCLKEPFQLPTRGEIFEDILRAKYFSKRDASSGFWQSSLDKESTRLCTFNTPFGRY